VPPDNPGSLIDGAGGNRLSIGAIADSWLPGAGRPRVDPIRHGGTTQVFRASRGGRTVFVRLAEEPGESMAAEAWVHEELRRRGARVPEVVAVEPVDEQLGRGVLVLTEMPGRPLADVGASDPELVRRSVAAAGRDLAVIGQVTIAGFGFLERDRPLPLRGSLPDARALLIDPVAGMLERLAGRPLDRDLARRAAAAVDAQSSLLDGTPSRLAHGDFDPTHIYVDEGGYAGLIDFGEIRGAPPLYDVAHYAVHERRLQVPTLAALLDGYGEEEPLPDDHDRRIALQALAISLRLLEIVTARGKTAERRFLIDAVDRMSSRLAG
jgi:Ser/Thr protein kinase RdoA (MazF antagonist)